jgi:hypothetical protein
MRALKYTQIIFFFLPICLLTSCFKTPLPLGKTRKDADNKLRQICREELKLPVTITPFKNTVWIYLPLQESFFDYKAGDKKDTDGPFPKAIRTINLLEGSIQENSFLFKYDISKVRKYAKDEGYTSYYTETYQKNQQGLLSAVYRAYASLEDIPGDVEYLDQREQLKHENLVKAYLKTAKAPEFFIVVIADISRGIEMRTTFYLADLKRGMTDASFYEEYARRLISESPTGNKTIINDTAGTHLEPRELTLPDFLVKQIQHRIRFKYQQSDFPPTGDDADEILKIIHAAVSAYTFKNFQNVQLQDLGQDKTFDFRREQLATFGQ